MSTHDNPGDHSFMERLENCEKMSLKDKCIPESSEFGPNNLAIHRPPTIGTFFTLPAGALGWRSSQTRRVKCRRACVTTHQSTTCTPDHTLHVSQHTRVPPAHQTTHRARVTTHQSTTCTPEYTQGMLIKATYLLYQNTTSSTPDHTQSINHKSIINLLTAPYFVATELSIVMSQRLRSWLVTSQRKLRRGAF